MKKSPKQLPCELVQSANACTYVGKGPSENVTGEFVLTSPAVSCMSRLSYLGSVIYIYRMSSLSYLGGFTYIQR